MVFLITNSQLVQLCSTNECVKNNSQQTQSQPNSIYHLFLYDSKNGFCKLKGCFKTNKWRICDRDHMWPTDPKVFTIQFFTEKFAQSLPRTVKSHILLYLQTDKLIWNSFVDDDKKLYMKFLDQTWRALLLKVVARISAYLLWFPEPQFPKGDVEGQMIPASSMGGFKGEERWARRLTVQHFLASSEHYSMMQLNQLPSPGDWAVVMLQLPWRI